MNDPKKALEGLVQRFRAFFGTGRAWPTDVDLGGLTAHCAYRAAELWLIEDIEENLGIVLQAERDRMVVEEAPGPVSASEYLDSLMPEDPHVQSASPEDAEGD